MEYLGRIEWNENITKIVNAVPSKLSMEIKRSRRRENKAIAKDKVDHTSTTPWTVDTLDHTWKGKAGFAVLNDGSSGIVLPTLAAPAFCEDQNEAALNQGLARLGEVGHACLSSAASTH